MFYTNGNYLDVELREELMRIRFEVIERCSEVIHHDYEGTNGPNTSNPFKILMGDYRVIVELENIDLSKELVPFDEKLEKISSELDSIPNRNIGEKREKLNELEYYLVQSEYNKRQVSVIPYYQTVLELVRKHNKLLVLNKGNI